MLNLERQAKILELIEEHGKVEVGDLSRRLGASDAALVADGESIILDSGTTTQQVARRLRDRRGLKVITNALNVAAELTGAGEVEVVLLGGLLRPNSGSLVGQFAEEMLRQFSVDKLFLA